jgi:PKD repeat protein
MIKKILTAGLVICAFLIAATLPVMAADETITINDGAGDVTDGSGKTVPDVTDIDFDTITYTRDDTDGTLEIEFVGTVKKESGIFITAALATTENEYTFIYINLMGMEEQYGSVITEESEEDIDFTLTGFGTQKLTITFELLSDDEDYDSIMVYTGMTGLDDEYVDIYPNIISFEAIIEGPTEGKVGESIQFSGSTTGGIGPYEWEWYIDEDLDTDSTEQNPTFEFDEEGEYEIELFVTDSQENVGFNVTSITITSGSTNGNNEDDGESPILLFVGLIVIIVIAGIAVLVFVIRR